MAKERVDPSAAAGDEDRGSWHLRGVGSWAFALALWLAAVGGVALFSRGGIEVGWARINGVRGTVAIEDCAHSSSYALCYGPFSATDGTVRIPRIELRTLHHDRPGAVEPAWLPGRSATHAWAGDVSPWRQLLPAAPFALLALIQTVWIMLSWRAGRRRRRLARDEAQHHEAQHHEAQRGAPARGSVVIPGAATVAGTAALPRPIGIARPPDQRGPAAPPPTVPPQTPPTAPTPRTALPPTAPTPPTFTEGDHEQPQSAVGGTDRRHPGWQDLRGTAAPPGPSTPQQRDRRQPWERPEHG